MPTIFNAEPRTQPVSTSTERRHTRVLVLTQYARDSSPGQRFRYEQYVDFLRSEGLEVDLAPFFDSPPSALHRSGRLASKIAALCSGSWRRFRLSLRFALYDRIVVFREAAPLGPPLVEWLAVRSGKPIVLDMDDAVFIATTSKANRALKWLKFPSRVRYIARHAERVMVCNPFLAQWASQYCRSVLLVPTTVDLAYHRSVRDRKLRTALPVIGWTGSNTTLKYLELIQSALGALQREFDFEFHVICDVDPRLHEIRNYRYVPWRRESEIHDLDAIDIGLMPVPGGAWEMGKVGFKAIQYGAMEIPAVVSDTGSGGEVVENGITGLVVENTVAAWTSAMRQLMSDQAAAAAMGRAARQRIADRYSTAAQRANYLRAFTGADLL